MKSAELNERNYQFKTSISMKTKTSILAVTKAFFILLVMCCFFSCSPAGSENDTKVKETYEIKVIDSCEYIYVSRRPWSSEFSLTHKGNCKYCAKRAKRF